MNTKQCETFLEKSRNKFGTKFIFNKMDYVNYHTKITITCPLHGDIQMTPDAHIKSKYGCRQCARVLAPAVTKGVCSPPKTTDQFIEDAKDVHGDTYIYDKTLYKNRLSPVSIECRKHGDFTLEACRHLEGRGCKQCYYEAMFLSQDEFIERANKIHNSYYTYEKTIYKGKREKVTITCPKHGDFSMTAEKHMRGGRCVKCLMNKEA